MKRLFKDHFIPHAGNDYAPHVLQRAAMGAMLGLVLISFTIANLQAVLWLNVDWLVSAVLPAVVVSETNDERAEGALVQLSRNPTLDRAAQLKAEHMAELGYFAHYAPDGTSPWHWFRSTNYSFVHAGENLAVHFNDSRELVRAWMKSPTHRANIMNGNYTEIGIGIAEGEFEGYNTIFVVQMFGTPAAPAVPTTPDSVTVVSEQVQEPLAAANDEAPTVAAAEETVVTNTPPTQTTSPTTDTADSETTDESTESYTLPTDDTDESAPVLPDTTNATTDTTASATPTSSLAAKTAEPDAEQFMSTTTNATPATVQSDGVTTNTPSFLGYFATSPQLVLQTLYMLLGLFVVTALLLSIIIEWRRQQPIQIAYSLALLLIMTGLYYVQTVVTAGAIIV